MHGFEWILVWLVGAVALTALARRLKLPYPSLLAVGGGALAFVPNAPVYALNPELTLAIFVAPVLLDAAFDTSLRDLKRFWVPVMSLVVIAVGITTVAVAWLVHRMVPGMPWAAAIALGAIVAPPDAAAANAIVRQLRIPHRVVVILEGESLLNDATALLIYRLAVSAATGTAFTSASIAPQAFAMFASIAVGFVLSQLYVRAMARVTDVPSAIVLQFVGAFGVWILADEFGLSAIVTIVTFAITASRLAPARTPARLRLPSYAVWETVVFVLNALAFILIGLQVRPILNSLEAAERTHYLHVAGVVLATVIVVRIAWLFTYNRAAHLKNRFFGPGYWPGSFLPPLSGTTIVSWCGMRGIVTLAAAYALPTGFPYRELILLCGFSVVVGTLVLQGLTLRPLIRAFRLKADRTVDGEVRVAQEALAQVAIGILDGDRSPAAEVLREEFAVQRLEDITDGTESERDARNRLRSHIVAAQRQELLRLRDAAVIGDDAFHRVEQRLDWTEVNAR